ncbi:Fe-only/vanadium nitrogenase subunit delta [Clostridium sp. WILCCON 0269]|uniref:nitrogenase n=1 Tax=Candidatus Clostridium eludens TaxID=3381663 RepID=A0ABW8SGU7_9CLOT
MKNRVEELFSFIQERYLWQFYSRSWDREQNIKGILDATFEILTGKQVKNDTLMDKYFYTEAKAFSEVIKKKFPWFLELDEAQKKSVINDLQAKLLDVVVTKSLNAELKNPNY